MLNACSRVEWDRARSCARVINASLKLPLITGASTPVILHILVRSLVIDYSTLLCFVFSLCSRLLSGQLTGEGMDNIRIISESTFDRLWMGLVDLPLAMRFLVFLFWAIYIFITFYYHIFILYLLSFIIIFNFIIILHFIITHLLYIYYILLLYIYYILLSHIYYIFIKFYYYF